MPPTTVRPTLTARGVARNRRSPAEHPAAQAGLHRPSRSGSDRLPERRPGPAEVPTLPDPGGHFFPRGLRPRDRWPPNAGHDNPPALRSARQNVASLRPVSCRHSDTISPQLPGDRLPARAGQQPGPPARPHAGRRPPRPRHGRRPRTAGGLPLPLLAQVERRDPRGCRDNSHHPRIAPEYRENPIRTGTTG